VRDVIASVAQKKRAEVAADTRLETLGFDSLMFTELGVALEGAGASLPIQRAHRAETVADVRPWWRSWHWRARAGAGKSVDQDRTRR
jgi:long-chain acyl-CoA synthetase